MIEHYQTSSTTEVAGKVLADAAIWGENISQLPMFADAVQQYMNKILNGELIISADE